ncbi:MAG: shikimate kinase [Candidatus Jordarchaeum sp.]|uniref:shikimate kinase n=1 Tax=Candidatus Jordarchaeum sp. TaxID=2823881 RepID=UPI00404B1DDF
MKGKALAFGAGTVVNAIATGFGAAFGLNLWTKAEVDILNEPGIFEGKILNDPSENTNLICTTARLVLNHFGLEQEYGASVITDSTIPISKGLKSSSAAANAVALATVAALKKDLDDLTIVGMGVEAALEAGVTITGAFDDACASYFGGFVVTDNLRKILISRQQIEENLMVMIHVPVKKSPTIKSNIKRIKSMKNYIELVFNIARNGDYKTALTLNGLIYSAALGFDTEATVRALEAGAVAAGLSGTGPATIALCPRDAYSDIEASWLEMEGEIIRTEFNKEKAKIV